MSNLFSMMVSNWKTSSPGAVMLASGVASLFGVHIAGLSAGDPWTLIAGGIGLLMAHDGVAPTA